MPLVHTWGKLVFLPFSAGEGIYSGPWDTVTEAPGLTDLGSIVFTAPLSRTVMLVVGVPTTKEGPRALQK